MFIITVVYVVATVLICAVNFRSVKATRDQLDESKRQYEEEHRAFISYELIYENRTWFGLRFINHGKRVATNVQLKLDKDFAESLTEKGCKEQLKRLDGQEFTLGIGQHYDIFLGSSRLRERPDTTPIQIMISYKDRKDTYTNFFYIDFSKYPPIFSVTTSIERMEKEARKLNESLSDIKSELKRLNHILEH